MPNSVWTKRALKRSCVSKINKPWHSLLLTYSNEKNSIQPINSKDSEIFKLLVFAPLYLSFDQGSANSHFTPSAGQHLLLAPCSAYRASNLDHR